MFDKLEKMGVYQATKLLGSNIIYIDQDNQLDEKPIRAIVNAITMEINPNTGEAILSDNISMDVDLGLANFKEGDIIVHKEKRYRIIEMMKDTFHSAKIKLQREEFYR